MSRTTTIDNSADTLDSRDIIARIEELRGEREASGDPEQWDAENMQEATELHALEMLQDEAEGYADWHHGEILIRDDYFTEYARELLDDCGMIPRDLPSWIKIDWEATARNIRTDYTAVDFDGVTYWIR
jgi:hypothetical protein